MFNFTRNKVQALYTVLSVTNNEIQRKAEEYIRILDIRAPSIAPIHNTSKYAVCVHIACREFNHGVDRDVILKYCSVDSSTYRDTYAVVTSILEISPQITIEKIAAQIGHPELILVAKKILIKYKERFINSLPEIQRQSVKFDTAPFISVPLVLAAEYRNVRVDRQNILDLTETRLKDFKKIYVSMDELVMQPIKSELEKINQNNPKKKKTKRKLSTPQKNIPNSFDDPSDPLPSQVEKMSRDPVKSELNSNVLVNNQKISEDQIEKDIQEFAINENCTVTLPKPLLDLKRKKEFQIWKESVLSTPQKVLPETEQTSLDDYFTKSTKKRKISKSPENTE